MKEQETIPQYPTGLIAQPTPDPTLTQGQKAAAAVEAKPLLAEEAKKNQATSAPGVYGGKKKTAFIKNDKSGFNPVDITPVHAQKDVAKTFDVSEGYVYEAQKIKDSSLEVFEAVKAGTYSIPDDPSEVSASEIAFALDQQGIPPEEAITLVPLLEWQIEKFLEIREQYRESVRGGIRSRLAGCSDLGADLTPGAAFSTVDELEQEVWVKVLERIDEFVTPGTAKLSTRLFALARFTAMRWKTDQVRQRRKLYRRIDQDEEKLAERENK